jgi:hypothetical protein
MKEVGAKWQSLTPPEKKIYQDMADEDKIRYKNELKEFEKEVEKLQVTKGPKARGGKTKKQPELKLEEEVKSQSKSMPDETIQKSPMQSSNLSKTIKDSSPKITNEPIFIKDNSPVKPIPKQKEPSRNSIVADPTTTGNTLVKDDNLIKKPLNITRPSEMQSPWTKSQLEKSNNYVKKDYKMQPEPYYNIKKNENTDQPAVTMDYRMTADIGGSENYNRLFPEGKPPPILGKRSRRISSIVGVPSQSNSNAFEFDDMFDNKNNEVRLPDSRKASIDFNPMNEHNINSPYVNDQRKNSGMYYFAGIPRQSPIESHFTQHPIFKSDNDSTNRVRKQSSNFPFPDCN